MWPEGINGRAIVNDIVQDQIEGLSLDERLKRHDLSKAKGESDRLVIWAGDAVAEIKDGESTQVQVFHWSIGFHF